MSDLIELKRRIYEDGIIDQVLDRLGCKNIRPDRGMYIASLPKGNNKRSVNVHINENLTSYIWSKHVSGSIYDIVSYIQFGCVTAQERKDNIYDAKMWLIEEFGYHDVLNKVKKKEPNKDVNPWLKDLKKKRGKKKKENNSHPNYPIDESIISSYYMIPYNPWIEEGISWETQVKFEVGHCWSTHRVVTMVRNMMGELIGVKGRTTDPNYKEKAIPKYIYLEKINKSVELFNLHRALPYILERKEVIIFEGYKSVMKADQYGYENSVSIEGDSISDDQVSLIKSLGLDIKVVVCYDKDKFKDAETIKETEDEIRKITNRTVYVVCDDFDLLVGKESPIDKGKDVWEKLYEDRYEFKG